MKRDLPDACGHDKQIGNAENERGSVAKTVPKEGKSQGRTKDSDVQDTIRRPHFAWRWVVLTLLLTASGLAWFFRPFGSGHLNPQEKYGKKIYFEGTSPRGTEIKAYIGRAQVELPGSAATCASCHGPDGRGRPEAGVVPSNITWDHLMKRYGHIHPDGRKHPAFTEASLKRCILTGYDPAGNRLDSSMPSYAMSADDINALVAYMKRLQTDLDPGVTRNSVRIGTVLPEKEQMGTIGEGMLEVVTAYFEDVNARGGIFNRRLELVASRFDNTRQTALAGVVRLLEEQEVFAMVGAVTAGADREIAQLVESKKVPLIGPLTLSSPDPLSLNEFTFYLYSGLTEQVRALVDFAAGELELHHPRIALVGPGADQVRDFEAAIEERCEAHGWTEIAKVDFRGRGDEAAAIAIKLKEERIDALFYLGYGGLTVLLEEAARVGWAPRIFMPGANAREKMLSSPLLFQKRIYLSYPTLPLDQTPVGLSEFQSLVERYRITVKHRSSQISAFVAAKILVEGLKSAGRDLTRQKLIRSLEQLYQFQTGLTPAITYGPNRRIGALGSHIVTIDLEKRRFVPVGGWITLPAL